MGIIIKNSNETDPDSNEMDLGMLDAEITQLLFRLMRLVMQWAFCIKIGLFIDVVPYNPVCLIVINYSNIGSSSHIRWHVKVQPRDNIRSCKIVSISSSSHT